jgi:hypothetical protein
VEVRAEQLQRELAKREPFAALRSGSKQLVPLPEGGRIDKRSRRGHPAYWAVFVLSDDIGTLYNRGRPGQQHGRQPTQ